YPEQPLRLLRHHLEPLADRIEQAWHVDARGFRNDALICYFRDPSSYERALGQFAQWWDDPARLTEGVGYWRETFSAPASHRETLFSANDRPAGLGAIASSPMLGPIAEHGYWGGARDRMPGSALDEFRATVRSARALQESLGRRLRIEPDANLCVIRSGQDLTDCSGPELDLYTSRVYPMLLKGMEFLRDHPAQTGCYSCRFMSELDERGRSTHRTFALAAFASLSHLEQWAESHPTHLAIFNEFLAMAAELGPQLRLRLWHEVFVLPAGRGHSFEYLNCHPATGLIPFMASGEDR
ncbi:MAG: phenylacetaldoxime dehydratase family protein, partial [Steroidobacteraceae bacterium]